MEDIVTICFRLLKQASADGMPSKIKNVLSGWMSFFSENSRDEGSEQIEVLCRGRSHTADGKRERSRDFDDIYKLYIANTFHIS